MQKLVPRKCFLTRGVGVHEKRLVSFELALRDAGIERFNLVPVSSIIPWGCEIVSREEGLEELNDGEVVFVVMARKESDKNEEIASAVGYARPRAEEKHGYIAEYSASNCDAETAKREAVDMAVKMLKAKLSDVKDLEMGGMAVSAKAREGEYTTVIAVAVFVI